MFQWYHSPARGIRVGYHPMSNSLVSSPIGWTHISCWLNLVSGVLRVEWTANGRQDVAYLDLEQPASTLEWFNDGTVEWQIDGAVSGSQPILKLLPLTGWNHAFGAVLVNNASGDAYATYYDNKGAQIGTYGKRGRLPASTVSGLLAWAPTTTAPQRLAGPAATAAVVIREVELYTTDRRQRVKLEFEDNGDLGLELTDADMNSQALTVFLDDIVFAHAVYFDGTGLRDVGNDERLCWCKPVDPNPKRQPTGCPKCGNAGTFIRMALCCPDHGAFGGM